MSETDDIRRILGEVLGAPKKDGAGWTEYDCPSCAERNGGRSDGKHNLAVDISDGGGLYGHCWKCGYSGSVYSIVKKYGSHSQSAIILSALKSLEKRGEYRFSEKKASKINDSEVNVPDNVKPIDGNADSNAMLYLEKRGIGERIIRRFNLGFIGAEYVGDYRLRNRIFIPSYDAMGDINYWVCRDYTGTASIKVRNSDVERNSIVFNEWYVNWYEPVTLVEGPFDHLVVPNSIPLLGKSLKKDSATYDAVMGKSMSYVNIMLDKDAHKDSVKLYGLLDTGRLKGKVRICSFPDIQNPTDVNGYDPSDYYRDFGANGILSIIRNATRLDEFVCPTFEL